MDREKRRSSRNRARLISNTRKFTGHQIRPAHHYGRDQFAVLFTREWNGDFQRRMVSPTLALSPRVTAQFTHIFQIHKEKNMNGLLAGLLLATILVPGFFLARVIRAARERMAIHRRLYCYTH
jgi:hypothetical protein